VPQAAALGARRLRAYIKDMTIALRPCCVMLVAALLLGTAGPTRADQNDPTLDALFQGLAGAKNALEAEEFEQRIWQVWVNSGQAIVDNAMERGLTAMNNGAYATSLKYFNDVVSLAPGLAEGWNKRATVFYLLGRYPESVRDIQRTLELEPRHFGALSGLGMIYMEMGQKKAAIRAMQKALAINPHMEALRHQLNELQAEVQGKPI